MSHHQTLIIKFKMCRLFSWRLKDKDPGAEVKREVRARTTHCARGYHYLTPFCRLADHEGVVAFAYVIPADFCSLSSHKRTNGTAEKAQWLRAPAALPKGQSSVLGARSR